MNLSGKTTWLLRAVFALLFSFLLVQVKLDLIESYFYDMRFRMRPTTTLSGEIELVLIDQKTVEHYKRIPGFADHDEVAQMILAQSPRALIYVTPIANAGGSDDEKEWALSSPTGSSAEAIHFAQTLGTSKTVWQVTDQLFLKGEKASTTLPAPFTDVPLLPAPKTADQNLFAKDGVTRRALVDYQGEPLGHPRIAALVHPELSDLSKIRGQFQVYETHQVLIDFQRPGSYPTSKFEDFPRHALDLQRFHNKIVLIGDDLGKSLKAYVKTPFSRDPAALTLLEMQANMFDTFIKNSSPIHAPRPFDVILTFLVSFFTLYVVLMLRPLQGLITLAALAMTLCLLGFIFFWPFQMRLPMAHSMLAVFLCYYFFIPYRLIIENRRSWEYQEKNRLLSKVEELKTNFISMMSHDLKTPIARIQGMTDVILKEPTPLSTRGSEALDHIRASSDDLLRFINAILNYAQIQSQGVQLHLQSRDINQILTEVLRKSEFLAHLKKIELIAELEPLFPIAVDPDLIRQVFSNLVENAIKYSPENSKVLITSEETATAVRVQVADQGPGVPEAEVENLFVKFYRSAEAKASPIKGSGLGLYLARYFVDLHQGQISVESSVGQGSTFTVDLPLKPKENSETSKI